MTKRAKILTKHIGISASLIGAVSLAFSPILFPAFASNITAGKISAKISAADLLGRFTPAGVDSKLAEKFQRGDVAGGNASNNNAIKIATNRFAFTPAGIKVEGLRTMTIAARTVSPLSSQAVSTRSIFRGIDANPAAGLSKSDFRLTAGKGWKGFSAPTEQKLAARVPVANLDVAAGKFRLDAAAPLKKSRFNADVRVDQNRNVAPVVGDAASVGDYEVDLEGSFSLSKRIAVTAGVRYQNERERMPLSAQERSDNEAVYVGTKIRF